MDYNRQAAVEYAIRWYGNRNPLYYNFENTGGDCTNFASQCLFAGTGIMNYTPIMGWYYRTINDRTPSWTGVQYFYDFITRNTGKGPYGCECDAGEVQPGDFVQLGGQDGFYHTPVVVAKTGGAIQVAAHSLDVFGKSLDSYDYQTVRFIKIIGVRE